MRQKYKGLILIISILFLVIACCREEPKQVNKKQAIIDSPSERRTQALKLIDSYPMQDWQNDTVNRIATIAGQVVSEEVKSRVGARLSEEVVKEKRIALLISVYNAEELARLAELYSRKQDKAILDKSRIYEDSLRDLVSPVLVEVLSNSPLK